MDGLHTMRILPKGSPSWVKWVVVAGFLGFAFKLPFVAVAIAAIFAVLVSKGYVTWE
jgi:hypothetical protein